MAREKTRSEQKVTPLTLRLPPTLHNALKSRADKADRSMNAEALRILRRSLARKQAA